MVDGLWIVQYEGTQGDGAGVVVFVNGRVLGGDEGFTYEGHYNLKDGWIAARIMVSNFRPSVPNVLGTTGDVELLMTAPIRQGIIRATLSVPNYPGLSLAARLTKKADL